MKIGDIVRYYLLWFWSFSEEGKYYGIAFEEQNCE